MGAGNPRHQRGGAGAPPPVRRKTLQHGGSPRASGEAVMFRVDWLQSALDELSALWLAADSTLRQAITAASHQIDTRLSKAPSQEGESREGDTRITLVQPLSVTFEVNEDDQVVTGAQV